MEKIEIEGSANDLSAYHNDESDYQLKQLSPDELLEALKKFVA